MQLSSQTQNNRGAFVLIITVVILALLTIMAVAFLSSSTSERAISRASANKAKSDLAAKTAGDVAIARLIDNLSQYPDSATTWESVNGTNPGTVLYFRDKTPEDAIATAVAAELNVLPLVSGATVQPVASKASSLTTLDSSNSFDLNHARFSGDTQGWIGAPPGSAARPEFRGQWINLTNSDGKVTGRYAYWMEDESFKANVNLMGKTLRGSNTLGDAPAQMPLQGLFKTVLGSTDPDAIATDTVTLRASFPGTSLFEYRALNHVKDQPTLADSLKFNATIYSGAANLSRSGSKRVNLNKVITTSIDATEIRKQLDEIIKPITYHLPNFAQRFYRTGADKNSLDVSDTGAPSHRTIYLNKIAANIRDYIDTDSVATIVNKDSPAYTVQVGKPTHSVPGGGAGGANEVIAIGKEAVPFLQEYMVRVKQVTFSNRLGTSANYKLEIDHYLEFWNMTNKDITVASLGANPFVRIANQFGWDSGGGNDIKEDPSRDFEVKLSDFQNSAGAAVVFKAGTATVLTTDPVALPATFSGVDATRVYRPAAGKLDDIYRVYEGVTKKKSSSELRINSIPRPVNSSTAADLETELILGNDDGILESFGAPAVYYMTVNVDDGTGATGSDSTRFDTTKYYFRASSLKGNAAATIASQVGDPRTNNEQLSITASTADDDQTAYKLEAWNSPTQISNTTFTQLNAAYVNPALWVDIANNVTDAAHAPMPIANAVLVSIGQLGDIFDPTRAVGAAPTGSANIQYSRGGGRTLKIGQPDRYDATNNPSGLWDGDSNSASREWAAWRLTDIFATSDSVQLDGRININGVNRDNGAALKTALYGYSFQPTPDSDPNLTGNGFDSDPTDINDKINELVKQMQARLKNDTTAYGNAFAKSAGPFAERGEFSELPMFHTGNDLVASVDTAEAYDRGREELFRRLVELTTTRGNIFTVYAVGQSLIPQAGTASPVVTSTSKVKITFRIDPVWSAGTPADPFDPTSTARFKKPDKYEIKILYAGD